MIDKRLYRFFVSFKIEGKVCLEWIEGINLRHAKDKIQLKYPDATDLMDWTNEKDEDLQTYLHKSHHFGEDASEAIESMHLKNARED